MIRRLPTPLRRTFHRVAYAGLTIASQVLRPRTRGVKCLVVCDGEVLLVRHAYGPRQWDLPGGFCRWREDASEAARRELEEELGVVPTGWVALGTYRSRLHGRREMLWMFRAEVATRDLEIDRGELDEVHWCSRERLPLPRARVVDVVVGRDVAVDDDG